MVKLRTRIARYILLLCLAVSPCWFLLQTGGSFAPILVKESFQELFPARHTLRQLALDLHLLSGKIETNGIFVSEKGLMRNLDLPNQRLIQDNAKAITGFYKRLSALSARKNTYIAILPTAAGVLQQNIPHFAQSEVVDQQRLIESIYNELSVNVRTVDVYFALQQKRDHYIYYRTDHHLTALGDYYTYTAIAKRLGMTAAPLSAFETEFADTNYYGDLYQNPKGTVGGWSNATAPYRKVQPDLISLFHYTSHREYLLTRRQGDQLLTYHTLYPKHCAALGAPLDVYLGGTSASLQIQTSSPVAGKLLVFGDRYAMGCLPFLSMHYQSIDFVNLYYTTEQQIMQIDPQQYEHVLFLYGIESFIHSRQPARVSYIQWTERDN